jgi:hypothetical protein
VPGGGSCIVGKDKFLPCPLEHKIDSIWLRKKCCKSERYPVKRRGICCAKVTDAHARLACISRSRRARRYQILPPYAHTPTTRRCWHGVQQPTCLELSNLPPPTEIAPQPSITPLHGAIPSPDITGSPQHRQPGRRDWCRLAPRLSSPLTLEKGHVTIATLHSHPTSWVPPCS